MFSDKEFDYLYMDSTGFRVYELSNDEIPWLLSEDRAPEFWKQREPLIGKVGGYVHRSEIAKDTDILPARTWHSDKSHPD